MGGGVTIPTRAIAKKLSPIKGDADDTARIQAAIDEVSAREPNASGFRGVILLERGTYRIATTLYIRASGVVLRGEGQWENGSILIGTGTTKRTLIVVGGKTRIREIEGSRLKMADDYVPWGAMSFELESTMGLSVGDSITVFRPSTKEWIHHIKMDQIKQSKIRKTYQWKAGRYDLRFERSITAIEKNRITLMHRLSTRWRRNMVAASCTASQKKVALFKVVWSICGWYPSTKKDKRTRMRPMRGSA